MSQDAETNEILFNMFETTDKRITTLHLRCDTLNTRCETLVEEVMHLRELIREIDNG